MIQDLLIISLSIGKYIFASALMGIFYYLLFREKTTFNSCRIYLISIALVSLLISQFNIVVYTPPTTIIEVPKESELKFKEENASSKIANIQSPVTSIQTANEQNKLLTVSNITIVVYITVTSVLFILLLIQLLKILTLKRRGKLTTKDGFEIVQSGEILTPFSFYKTIFLSPNLSGSKLEMIFKHEQWHIKHRHYLDVFIMEVLVRLFWFNPVLWWVRRELRNVSEFHADRSVLDEGQDLYKYQTIILEEVMEYNHYLANGFNNSFTKKRFIMMKKKCNIRYATLRRTLILPFFISVFSLLCFTTGKSEVKYEVKNDENADLEKMPNPITQLSLTSKQTLSKTINSDSVVVDSSKFVSASQKEKQSNLVLSNSQITEETADLLLNSFDSRLSSSIEKINKLLKEDNVLAIKQGLYSAITVFDRYSSDKKINNLVLSDEFCNSVTETDLIKCVDDFTRIKNEVEKLKNSNSKEAKLQGHRSQMNIYLNSELMKKVSKEMHRIQMQDHYSARNYYNNSSSAKVTTPTH